MTASEISSTPSFVLSKGEAGGGVCQVDIDRSIYFFGDTEKFALGFVPSIFFTCESSLMYFIEYCFLDGFRNIE